jgi:2,4'-dihydroxyacetophenone dioxygenase
MPPVQYQSVNEVTEIVDRAGDADPLWMKLTDAVELRPLMFDCSNGAWTNLLRVSPGGSLARHYHTAPVHAFVVKGAWRYLEHDWVAETGTFIHEPPGELHTLVADAQRGMTTFFVTRGSLVYTDEKGLQIGFEDVFTRLKRFRNHLRERNLDPSLAERMIR